ncbi:MULTISPECIES: SpoIID/LytB domain-containing protein [Clostridium]|uniref:Amidase enhancer n=2 Tax=Clostridium TaxID=1485 RepID=D8GM33_CLOLD|nr:MULTISPECIES: SpoIID/LytB domain-containing protein [Clostridium]ADK15607.1 SpoIID-like domain containing protein [Clostridium ljungdahlii DSM 13528]AGY74847.1 SpoIID/LytB domain-containing protein [Clostridium autoethanogenum DSM 10061]ALU35024.1 putative secreted protein SpoIID domain [Clostridium autoethanogenum DSM 10061]OAA86488.1 Amidase enhancer precursor [Clostridium ljungdahlii DSM 13528]OVY49477.1 Amidase enhancer precursor [Clostridium autoethanogenum]
MFKRYFLSFTTFTFFIAMLLIAFTQKAYAYQNSGYFNNVKVGLLSMSSTTIAVKLNGDYTLNGQVYSSGSILNLGISGTSITLNGVVQSQITLTPNNSSNLVTLTSGSVSNKYLGSFSIKFYNGKVLPINMIDIESYLKGVVGYELDNSCPIEALKAQAVAARNYAISRIGYAAANGYDFDDTPAYQTYKGYDANLTNVISAVDQTKGQVLLYNDKLVETLYSAWHGGVSEDSENVWGNYVPYLRSVQDPFEKLPWPNGNIVLTNSQIQAILVNRKYIASTDTFVSLDLSSITKFTSGRVSNINIIYKDAAGSVQTKSVTNDCTRTFLGLPSNLYTVTYDAVSGAYTFSGMGNGHGLGMSQIGAKNRASAGQTYDQILKFYYQNVYLQNLITSAILNNFTQSTNSLLIGNTISFNAAATSGSGTYLYKYVVTNGTNVVYTKDYNNISSLDYVPSTQGNYTAQVYMKDQNSTADYDDTKTSSFIVYGNPVINNLTTNKPQYLTGQTVNINTTAASGSGGYLYKYVISLGGTTLTTVDYSKNASLTYKVNSAGDYNITVYMKDSLSTKDYDGMKTIAVKVYDQPTMTYTSTQNFIFIGGTVNYTISEVNGSGSAQYRFVVMNGSSIAADSGYLSSNTFSFKPAAAGSYQVIGYLKDSLSEKAFDVQGTLNLNVYNPQIKNVNVSGYFYVGTILSFYANSTGTSPSGMSYRYEVYNNGKIVASSNFSTSSTFSFTPAVSGTYTVKVYGKDGLSTKSYDSIKQFNITVNSKPLYISTLPLSLGMTSSDVAALQNALIKLGYNVSGATGYFGTQTKSAVIAFQTDAGIPASGTVGTWTYSALNDALITKSGIKNLSF